LAQALHGAVDEMVHVYDERFCRMWEFYLVLCEIGFRYRAMVVFQLQLAKRLDAVPLIRDDMVDWERDRYSQALTEHYKPYSAHNSARVHE
jgi:Mycolic acid cyclopropane synthetase